jgi:hypothetical protein
MSITSKFDPARDGWYFENWAELAPYCIGSCEFSWDLYRQTYLGINPTNNLAEAPLDWKYYDTFYKSCAKTGNCVGMSLLALALFKYGGYMGFCASANLYTGVKSPDREDLHRTINILHGRQASAPGIEYFLDIVNSGNLSNAEAAFKKIKALFGNGDYPVLMIATNLGAEAAHTVVPYELDEQPDETKVVYFYDPVFPYDKYRDYYISRSNRLVISGPFKWEYVQGVGTDKKVRTFSCSGSGKAWCFAFPMSLGLRKARQPIALDMAIEGLTELFVSGRGAAVAQIEDETGRRFYKTEADGHVLRDEIETDPTRRLLNIGRWPWYGRTEEGELPGELYFMRRPVGSPALQITLYGGSYRLMCAQAGNLVELEARGQKRARDVVRLAGVTTSQQALALETDGEARRYDIHLQRLFGKGGGWRSIALQNARVSTGGLQIHTAGDLQVFEISSLERKVNFSVELKQYTGETLTARSVGRHGAAAGRTVRFTPQDWNELEETEVKKETFQRGKGEGGGRKR